MFDSIKRALWFSIKKDFSVAETSEGVFYPLTNSNYNLKELWRSDYIRLYIWRSYAAVSTIADAIAELEYSLKRTKKDDRDLEHPYLELITYELLQDITGMLQLTGSCYLLKAMIGSKIDSLEVLRTDLVMIEENNNWSIKGYRYVENGKNYFYRTDEIISFDLFSPLKTYPHKVKGVSPMQAVAIQAEMDNTANRYNWNFFKNNWSVKEILSTDQQMKPENKERLISKWKNDYQWVNNAHKMAVLDSWLKYQSVNPSQKEMDFVESRRFTRDEILAIYKVPKSIVGIADDVNRANALTAERTFAKRCLSPLAKQIAERLNKTLFKWIGVFGFINVVPVDTEQLEKDYNNGAITTNEYRRARGYQQIKDWDRLKINPTLLSEPIQYETTEKKSQYSSLIKNIIRKNIKGTSEHKASREEEGQAQRETKIKRTNNYEEKYIKIIGEMFDMQKRDVIKQFVGQKSVKKISRNILKYVTIRQNFLFPVQKEVVANEWNQAYEQIWLTTLFKVGDPSVNKWMKENINKFAKDVDLTTKEKVLDIIEQGNLAWHGADKIANEISKQFEEFKHDRAKKIARTEITRAANYSQEQARIKSGVVEAKEWFTASDERVCPHCWPMNGKIIELGKNYFDKWDTYENDWKVLKFDYGEVKAAPLHPNCRCTLIPVIR